MFCTNCGTENDNNAKFCKKCGSSLGSSVDEFSESPEEEVIETNENTNNYTRIIVICICIIIIVAGICAIFIESKKDCTLTITNEEFTEDNPLIIKLTDSKGNSIPDKTVEISFSNNEASYDFTDTTNEEGSITVTQTFNLGTYNVTCNFEGDDKYNPASDTKMITIKAKPKSTINNHNHESGLSEDGYSYYPEYGPAVDSLGYTREYAIAHNWHYIPGRTDDGYDIGMYVPYDSVAGCYHT
jgi:hypothetical protein